MTTSRDQVVWRHLPRGTVLHALRSGPRGPDSISLCGTAPVWFAPADARWQEPAGRDGKPECGRCAKLLAPKGEPDADRP